MHSICSNHLNPSKVTLPFPAGKDHRHLASILHHHHRYASTVSKSSFSILGRYSGHVINLTPHNMLSKIAGWPYLPAFCACRLKCIHVRVCLSRPPGAAGWPFRWTRAFDLAWFGLLVVAYRCRQKKRKWMIHYSVHIVCGASSYGYFEWHAKISPRTMGSEASIAMICLMSLGVS